MASRTAKLVTVGSTSKTLSELLVAAGSAVREDAKWIQVVNLGTASIYCWIATADATGIELPPGAMIELEVSAADAAEWAFYAAANQSMAVVQSRARLAAYPANTALAAIQASAASGLPVKGTDATGANAYATVVTAPSRQCHHIKINNGFGGDVIVSLDGGTTDHFLVESGEACVLSGLTIASGATIQAKNSVPGNNYADLTISVW